MKRRVRQFFEFGKFRLDVERSRLIRDEEIILLPPKVAALLLILLKHPGRAVEKEELLESIWPDSVVEDSNLTQTVHLLRKALGKYPDPNISVETLPRFGYRLVAEVRELWSEGIDSSPNLKLSSPSTPNLEQFTAAATEGVNNQTDEDRKTEEPSLLSLSANNSEVSSSGQLISVNENNTDIQDNQSESGLFSSLRTRGAAWFEKRGLKIIAKLLISLSQS